jgi:hypothetical protein
MNQDADKVETSTPDEEDALDAQDEAMVTAELDDDEAALEMREGSGDLDALADMTRSDTFDAQAIAASNATRPAGAARPMAKPKASGLKSTAVFPVMTVGMVLIGFAVYGIMLLNGNAEASKTASSTMPKIMVFVAGPLGLIMEIIGVGLLVSVIDDKKKEAAKAAAKQAAKV